jgi:hypothetical protein
MKIGMITDSLGTPSFAELFGTAAEISARRAPSPFLTPSGAAPLRPAAPARLRVPGTHGRSSRPGGGAPPGDKRARERRIREVDRDCGRSGPRAPPDGVIAQPSEPHANPISCALRASRDNPPASVPPCFGWPPFAGPFGGGIVPLTCQNQGKRYPTPRTPKGPPEP